MTHSALPPSSAHRWMKCHGSVAGGPKPQDDNFYADEGTAAHQLAAFCLKANKNAAECMGDVLVVCNDDGTERRRFTVDADMASFVQVYLDSVRDRLTPDAILLTEVRVGGELPTAGTADVCIVYPARKKLSVHDLKYGRGKPVFAKENEQLRLYGLQAMFDLEPLYGEFTDVEMHIHQPRLDAHSMEAMTGDELRE